MGENNVRKKRRQSQILPGKKEKSITEEAHPRASKSSFVGKKLNPAADSGQEFMRIGCGFSVNKEYTSSLNWVLYDFVD